ncbi:DUF3558 domain-containing protein [Nocardia amikacinitolerans]|uniref:DUF3558 domain-containing protein n=1 Tax=Nocardia amikacinitolerans TaxID=756689 RepID=UPI003558CC5A
MIRNQAALQIIVAVLTLAACGTDTAVNQPTTSAATPTTRPSLAVSVSPAPTQINRGRQAVTYDPCTELDDGTVATLGYDPKSRERADFIFETYSFIGCRFARNEQVRGRSMAIGYLTISSTNITLDEFRNRDGAESEQISINGREALTRVQPSASACNVTFEALSGAVDIAKTMSAVYTDEQPCEGINRIAETIESKLPQR